jgi:putative Mn2+ efflux pump MntP
MLGLFLVALALGASNFAASFGIGMGGVDNRTRLRVGVFFGIFEAAMPLIGLAIGRGVSGGLGSASHYVGAVPLIAVGGYTTAVAFRTDTGSPSSSRGSGRLLLVALALSIDNLVVGFALGTLRVAFVLAAATIGVISIAMSLVGLEIGGRLGARFEQRSEIVGGVVLVGVGCALAFGLLG